MINTFHHIFTAGTYPQWSPEKSKMIDVTITPEHLAQIAASYDPSFHTAPLWIGHPFSDAPALGWFGEIKAEGDKLYGKLSFASDELINLIRNQAYKRVSVEIYKWMKDKVETLYLGACGLTNMPLVKNLPDFELQDKSLKLAFAISNHNNFSFQTKLNFKMEQLKKLAAGLNIPVADDATEDSISTAIAAKFSELSTELATLKATSEDQKAEILVASAIDAGKIMPSQKENYLSLAKTNFSAVQNLFKEMKPTDVLKANQVPSTPPVTPAPATSKFTIPDDRKTWSYRDWEIKAPKDLKRMQSEDPKLFEQLQDTFYNS